MLPTLLRLFTRHPDLLADHAQAYAELVGAELLVVGTHWRRQAVYAAVGLCAAAVAATLGGVALMLWLWLPLSAQSPGAGPVGWLLLAVPLPPLALALWCARVATQAPAGRAFDTLRHQASADLALLDELAAR